MPRVFAIVALAPLAALAVAQPKPAGDIDLRALAPPAPDGSLGTAHPLVVDQVARDGSWAVLCQARADTNGDGAIAIHAGRHGDTYGDALLPYLVVGSGTGVQIDSLLDFTRDSAWLAILRKGTLELVDVRGGRTLPLKDADVRDDGDRYRPHRAASLADDGNRLLYLRSKGGKDQIVIRELATRAERVVDVKGKLWRATADDAGKWARVEVIRDDTDKNGKLEWPSVMTSLSARGCRGPIMSYSTSGMRGDIPKTIWLDLQTGAFTEDDTVVRALGDQLARQLPDGSITLGGQTIAPASCNAQVVAWYVDRDDPTGHPPRVLATCGTTKATDAEVQATVTVFGDGLRKDTTIKATRRDRTSMRTIRDRYVCDERCVELATGSELKMPGKARAVIGNLVVLEDKGAWSTLDLVTAAKQPLAKATGDWGGADGELVVIGGVIYHVGTGKRVGKTDTQLFGHTHDGRVLAAKTPSQVDFPDGPLVWNKP